MFSYCILCFFFFFFFQAEDGIRDATVTGVQTCALPIFTTSTGLTIDVAGNPVEVVTTGRHDPCVGLRATPIAEAMLAIVLMDHYLRHRAQNADVKSPTPDITAASRR